MGCQWAPFDGRRHGSPEFINVLTRPCGHGTKQVVACGLHVKPVGAIARRSTPCEVCGRVSGIRVEACERLFEEVDRP